jgi:hypothetical protein
MQGFQNLFISFIIHIFVLHLTNYEENIHFYPVYIHIIRM